MTGTASATNSTTPKSSTAVCPAGKVVLGGGYTVTATSGAVIRESRATANDTWTVSAFELNNTSDNWSVQAFAICVTAN